MTRQEAADIFRERLDVARTYYDIHGIEDYTQAMELAVEVLDAEPSADVISRQDAIEAVRGYWITVINADDRPTIDGQALTHNKGLKKILEDLPPAQPELVLCRDCKRYNRHDHRCTVWNHGIHTDDWCSRAERRNDG